MAGKFQVIADAAHQVDVLTAEVAAAIDNGDKADFALELLFSDDIDKLGVPTYIEHGLLWLEVQLRRIEKDLAPKGDAT